MERRAATASPIVACYREFEPPPALRGRVRALFSFVPNVEPRPQRRITLEMSCAAGEACPSPMFADGNSSIVFDIGPTFYTDGVLLRQMRERVGVSPKLYCRLARFQSALSFARAGESVDWARAAFELGYADQSHMIAEFRQFTSLTPHMLATERWFHPFIERAKSAAPTLA